MRRCLRGREPHHDYPDRAARDSDQEQAMLALGYRTIRFHHQDNWVQIIAESSRSLRNRPPNRRNAL